jgi:glutamine amidotransferase
MIAIVDYDAGNLRSVEKALLHIGADCVVTRDPEKIRNADRVILPGVGAFQDAMKNLEQFELIPVIKETVAEGKPFLGICLGLQLLFADSEENPGVKGLNLLPGHIIRIPATDGLKIPHIGWNSIEIRPESRLFKNIPNEAYVYFVHSYYLKAEDEGIVAATCEYGAHIHAAVEQDNVFATQFHPEKSGALGLQILQNFATL